MGPLHASCSCCVRRASGQVARVRPGCAVSWADSSWCLNCINKSQAVA